MSKDKILILRFINDSSGDANNFSICAHFKQDARFYCYIEELFNDGYIEKHPSRLAYLLSSKGRAALENHYSSVRLNKSENIKFAISTGIALAALIAATYSLWIQR